MQRIDITAAVSQAVADALGAELDEVTPDATLLDDLGAESIDLLDILFRLERSLKVKIQAAQLAAYVQGGIADDEFGDADEIITEKGLAQLARVMPQIDVADLRGELRARKVMSLFTVDNLVDLVVHRISVDADADAATADALAA